MRHDALDFRPTIAYPLPTHLRKEKHLHEATVTSSRGRSNDTANAVSGIEFRHSLTFAEPPPTVKVSRNRYVAREKCGWPSLQHPTNDLFRSNFRAQRKSAAFASRKLTSSYEISMEAEHPEWTGSVVRTRRFDVTIPFVETSNHDDQRNSRECSARRNVC